MTRKDRLGEDASPWNRPLVFWRDSDGRRTGLACLTTFCDNPDCTCQEAHIHAYEVDDRFLKLSVSGDHVSVMFDHGGGPVPSGRALAVVDLGSGRVERMENSRPRRRKAEFRRWLEEAVDAAVLEDLRARWRGYKAELKRTAGSGTAEKWRDQDWTEWDGEEPVGWFEAHPETTEDRCRLDGNTYEARDFYCILPECECGQVTVRFGKVEEDLIEEVIGEVFVEAASGEVVGTSNAPGERRRLDRLWQAYEKSNDVNELSRRYREMQRIGPGIHALRERQLRPAPAHRGAKVGRNEPCPCGSGRKYKKCCGRRA